MRVELAMRFISTPFASMNSRLDDVCGSLDGAALSLPFPLPLQSAPTLPMMNRVAAMRRVAKHTFTPPWNTGSWTFDRRRVRQCTTSLSSSTCQQPRTSHLQHCFAPALRQGVVHIEQRSVVRGVLISSSPKKPSAVASSWTRYVANSPVVFARFHHSVGCWVVFGVHQPSFVESLGALWTTLPLDHQTCELGRLCRFTLSARMKNSQHVRRSVASVIPCA